MSARIQHAADFGKVAVLLGGSSAEREISLKSGRAVLAALRERGVDAHAVDTAEAGAFRQLEDAGYARAFNALHGRGGEDGVIQGALALLGMPCTGSGVLGSALAMDKIRSKQLWQGMGLPTPAFAVLDADADLETAAESVGFPMMIKPAHEGSSIGMTRVQDREQLNMAWDAARHYDSAVLAEQWISGAEYTIAVLEETALPAIRLQTPHEFYDYEAKYFADTTEYLCPCGLPVQQEQAYQSLALQAFRAVGASGWGRVDLMADEGGMPWLIEVNTVPGMTDHSLVPMAARAAGMEFDELVWRILETSLPAEVKG